jgi:hypothetical protein
MHHVRREQLAFVIIDRAGDSTVPTIHHLHLDVFGRTGRWACPAIVAAPPPRLPAM